MAIYEYRRPDGSTFEVIQSMSEPPLEQDPESGVPVERVFHAPAIHFKGSGFYNTDYGKKKKGTGSSDSSASESKPDSSSSESKSDSASASSADNGSSSKKSSETKSSASSD